MTLFVHTRRSLIQRPSNAYLLILGSSGYDVLHEGRKQLSDMVCPGGKGAICSGGTHDLASLPSLFYPLSCHRVYNIQHA